MRAIAGGSMTSEPDNRIAKGTLLLSIWALTTLLWSIFTPPHKTFPARVLLFQPAWVFRAVRKDTTWIQDLALFEVLHTAYGYFTGAWRFASNDELKWLDINDPTMWLYVQTFSLLGLCGMLAGTIVYRGHHLKAKEVFEEPLHEQRIDEQVLPPLLLSSRTSHSRVFPQKHSFSYSYLYVGVPVGVQGRISNVLSVDSQRHGWFVVDAADYLNRDSEQMSLAEKLKRWLHTQGVTDRDYAFAYLVTAPRFLGYSFNPVSFWYLYDSDTKLKYMVLEVNNTFGERRMYLLRSDNSENGAEDGSAKLTNGNDDDANKALVFSETWQKDFHVSPFNSRKGSYSLKAVDPLAAYEQAGQVRIDNTIVLRSSKEHAKIVARVWSEGEAKDPTQLSTLEAVKFILAWCWVGFATFPRIVWEASKLFFQRKLHVWYRPEVADTSVGRTATDDERDLEAFFRAFLTHAVTEAQKPLRVIYEPRYSQNTEIVLYSPDFTYEEDHKRTLTIKVLSPAFYSRFVHYSHAKEAFDRECLATDEKNRTAHIERADLLPVLLGAIDQQDEASASRRTKISILEQMRWTCLRRLRCPPAAASYPEQSQYQVTDIRSFGHSELDRFVLRGCDDSDIYRRIATKLFLAERIALGVPALVVGMDMMMRLSLLLASMLYSDRSDAVDVLRPRDLAARDAVTIVIMLTLANTVHLWSVVKG